MVKIEKLFVPAPCAATEDARCDKSIDPLPSLSRGGWGTRTAVRPYSRKSLGRADLVSRIPYLGGRVTLGGRADLESCILDLVSGESGGREQVK